MTETRRYFSGLDLAQPGEFTALAVLEQTRVPDPESPDREMKLYAVRHLERFPLGTPYSEVFSRVRERFASPPLAGSMLVVDLTGVGKPVLDVLRRLRVNVQLKPVTITAGHHAGPDGKGGWLVPKMELVSLLQVLLQSRRLKFASGLPEAEMLVKELEQFRMKVTTAKPDDVADWRAGPRDDLVLALAVGMWVAERASKQLWVSV